MEKIIHISAGTEYSCSMPIANSGEDGYMQYSFSKSELAIYADVFFDISLDAAIILNEYISKFSKDCDVNDWVKVGDSAPNFNFQESSSETMCCLLGALCPSHKFIPTQLPVTAITLDSNRQWHYKVSELFNVGKNVKYQAISEFNIVVKLGSIRILNEDFDKFPYPYKWPHIEKWLFANHCYQNFGCIGIIAGYVLSDADISEADNNSGEYSIVYKKKIPIILCSNLFHLSQQATQSIIYAIKANILEEETALKLKVGDMPSFFEYSSILTNRFVGLLELLTKHQDIIIHPLKAEVLTNSKFAWCRDGMCGLKFHAINLFDIRVAIKKTLQKKFSFAIDLFNDSPLHLINNDDLDFPF